MMDFISVRILFRSLEDATEALIMVLEYARQSDKDFSFGSLTPEQVLMSGLLLIGDAEEIATDISSLPSATLYRN